MKHTPGYKGIYNQRIKGLLDYMMAVLFLIVLWPVFLLIAACIFLDTGCPVFYKAQRGGYKNKPFWIIKFRTMVKDADKTGGGTTAMNDKRITRTGAVLRKAKLDEIPQLINILKGEMSFVGPRPELLRYTLQYKGKEKLIFKVKPGITDYSSLAFINLDELVGDTNADKVYEEKILKQKNKLRVRYAQEVSFSTDVYLFLITIGKVIQKTARIVKERRK